MSGYGRRLWPLQLRNRSRNSNPSYRSQKECTNPFSTACAKAPYRRSAPELVRALQRVEEVRNLGIDVSVSHRIPPGRLQALARFASTAKASVLRKLPDARRIATLVAFVSNLEGTALDDALDLLDILISEIFSDAERASSRARLRTIKDLDAAAIQLTQVCRVVLG